MAGSYLGRRRIARGMSACRPPRAWCRVPPTRGPTASPFSWPDPLGREDTMRPRFRPFALTLLLALTWLVATPPPGDAQTPKRGGTLRVSYGNEIANLDFHTAPGYEMMWVAMNVGCSLTNITPDGKFVGDAAESWPAPGDRPPHQHRPRREVRGRGRGVVDDVVRRPALHLQAAEERPLPRRHPGGRGGGQVQHRADDGPRHQVTHA